MTDPCRCSHDATIHSYAEPTVCKDINCKCTSFESATPDFPTRSNIDRYKAQHDQVKDRVRFLLENIKYLRNFNNTGFVISYWELMCGIKFTKEQKERMIDPETIRRCKQLLVEKDEDKYGPIKLEIIEEKQLKQIAITDWIIENK